MIVKKPETAWAGHWTSNATVPTPHCGTSRVWRGGWHPLCQYEPLKRDIGLRGVTAWRLDVLEDKHSPPWNVTDYRYLPDRSSGKWASYITPAARRGETLTPPPLAAWSRAGG